MVLPIVLYGHPVLRKSCRNITDHDDDLKSFIDNMWKTMEYAGGAGLAAPQVNMGVNTFIVNSKIVYDNISPRQQAEEFKGDTGIIETFINARIITKSEDEISDFEGCLSIPGITEEVNRAWDIDIEYLDVNFKWQRKQFSGYTARVIQHEYDHTRGVLYIDHLPGIKRKMLGAKLRRIASGKVDVQYKTILGK
jgi:peptide deformylase